MPQKNPKGRGAKLWADITPRVDVILVSFVRGERMSAGLNSLGGMLWVPLRSVTGPDERRNHG